MHSCQPNRLAVFWKWWYKLPVVNFDNNSWVCKYLSIQMNAWQVFGIFQTKLYYMINVFPFTIQIFIWLLPHHFIYILDLCWGAWAKSIPYRKNWNCQHHLVSKWGSLLVAGTSNLNDLSLRYACLKSKGGLFIFSKIMNMALVMSLICWKARQKCVLAEIWPGSGHFCPNDMSIQILPPTCQLGHIIMWHGQ